MTTTTDAELRAQFAARTAKHYAARLAAVAAELRTIADEVEREGRGRTDWPDGLAPAAPYTYAAGRALHTVTWGLANLRLDTLLDRAGEADAATRAAAVPTIEAK